MDPRFLQEKGTQVFTGTELLLKGALEASVSFLTGYPGSPVADFFNNGVTVREYLQEKGIVLQIANNEALGAARVNGSQMEDIKAMLVLKSVGAHVASDGLALGNISKTGKTGGVLVVIGDDPWSESTQVPTDSRYLSKHLHMPVMEPSTFQELKDWVSIGLDLSAKSDLYVSYLVTTNIADGGGTVTVYKNQVPAINRKRPVEIDTSAIPVEETVVLSPRTAVREETLPERYADLIRFSKMHEVNRIVNEAGTRKIGLVASGMAFTYLQHALHEMDLGGKIKILKLGITFPLDQELVRDFSRQVDQIVVIEEKRDFIESQVTTILKNTFQTEKSGRYIPVWGKEFPGGLPGIPSARGLNPSLLISLLGPLFLKILDQGDGLNEARIQRELALIQQTERAEISVPPRTPTFCPGCPHRDSAGVLLEIKKKFRDSRYMRKYHNRDSVDLVFHGDTGCYTMLMFEPYQELMHNYSGMGLGGGTGAGIDPFIMNKQVVFMGDSTFFHSGMLAISDAVKHNQDITFVILDNGATAMTGHQPTPGQKIDIEGHVTVAQDIESVVRGLARGTEMPVYKMNPSYRTQYGALLEDMILRDGVKVVIADKECGITYDRKVAAAEKKIIREKGYLPKKRFINITEEVCEYCLECTKMTGCPGLTIKETAYGPKVMTDISWCKSDGACTKIYACPSFEEVIVKRKRPVPEIPFDSADIQALPVPPSVSFSDSWRLYMAGIGGMGIGLTTAILVLAGWKKGYGVKFLDKKGLAIRNGGVYSHILYSKSDALLSAVTPYGKADLLIGLDLVEAVRSADPKMNLRAASPQKTIAVVNTHQTPTVTMLTGKDDFHVGRMEKLLKQVTRSQDYFGADISEVAERYFGNKLFSNILMLGVAYQKGLLPLELEHLEWAIKQSVKRNVVQENMKAFYLGRLIAVHPERYLTKPIDTYEFVLNEKERILSRRRINGPKLGRTYRNLVMRTVAALRMDDETNTRIARYLYDLIQYENIFYARQYAEILKQVKNRDRQEFSFEATRAAMQNLHRVMIIKDEIYVSHLLTSEEKRNRDYQKYQIDPLRGDRLLYRHLTEPEINIFGWKIRMKIKSYNWQLHILKQFKFLRRIFPLWHRREKLFRNWYVHLVREFKFETKNDYDRYVKLLSIPEEVRGYRDIRYPKMNAARKKAESLIGPETVKKLNASQARRLKV